ncbi:uncharacterized protein LOC111638128 [Centruroides sculpturatus]|uniref:uncharacterized protein LOC111638128 n=1 Tax=Centruroides sculpturatus TaxID=218467 RepID=UPI000C6CF1BF|nr:uncharacterized protein LOC111638128 [Centruroides sculpturatus]
MTTCRAKYCMAELTTIMGVLAGFDRRCADRCREMCVERGVGIRKEVCTVCCQKESSRPSASVYWYEKSKKKKKKNHPVFEYYTCGTEKLFGSSGLVVPRPLLLFLSILPLGI